MTLSPRERAAALLLVLLAAATFACSADRANGPGDAGTMAQEDDTDDDTAGVVAVSRQLSVTLRTGRGVTVAGVRVDWRVTDGDFITPPYSVTDELGRVTARWTFGANTEQHTAVAMAPGFGTVTISGAGAALKPLQLNEFRALRFTTYDGAGQTVHPDYVKVETAALAGNFLALTPYAWSLTEFENPVVYTSADLVRWRVPSNSPNPLATTTAQHLSDPDMVFDPIRRELLLYYREVGYGTNTIMLIHSADGVKWSDPSVVVRVPSHELVSPAFVRRNKGEWLMWAVNGHAGCQAATADVELRRSTDGLAWSVPEHVSLTQHGYFPWHIEVQWVPSRNEYWALYNVKTAGSCSTPALYFATSPDGVTWKTYPSPLVSRGAMPALADIVYRSTFDYDPFTSLVTFWYSGARYNGSAYVWGTVAQRLKVADVFARVSALPRAALLAPRPNVPPLLDPP